MFGINFYSHDSQGEPDNGIVNTMLTLCPIYIYIYICIRLLRKVHNKHFCLGRAKMNFREELQRLCWLSEGIY